MKILLIHKFHYMLGGTETFHYNLAEALKMCIRDRSIVPGIRTDGHDKSDS